MSFQMNKIYPTSPIKFMCKKWILFFLISAIPLCFCVDENQPDLKLNSLDVPIFHQGNPLQGLRSFTILPQHFSNNLEINNKIRKVVEKELGSLGNVIELKGEDVTGFASNGLLNIQIGNVSNSEGGQLPILRVSVNLETPVLITKTNVKSMPRVWAINDFVETSDKTVPAVQKLLRAFVENYKFANPNEKEKPTFYIY